MGLVGCALGWAGFGRVCFRVALGWVGFALRLRWEGKQTVWPDKREGEGREGKEGREERGQKEKEGQEKGGWMCGCLEGAMAKKQARRAGKRRLWE